MPSPRCVTFLGRSRSVLRAGGAIDIGWLVTPAAVGT